MKTNRTLFLTGIYFVLLSFNNVNAQTAAKATYVVHSPSTEMTFDVQLIKDVQAGKFILAVENPESLDVNITVEGSAGIAYKSQLNSLSFRKRFDLSDKKDGEYIIIVNTGRKIYRHTVLISTSKDLDRMLSIK